MSRHAESTGRISGRGRPRFPEEVFEERIIHTLKNDLLSFKTVGAVCKHTTGDPGRVTEVFKRLQAEGRIVETPKGFKVAKVSRKKAEAKAPELTSK